MKRIVSFEEFFTILGLGLWQAICFVGKAFNYKNKTPFWRVIWSILTLCVIVFTGIIGYLFYEKEFKTRKERCRTIDLSDKVYSYNVYGSGYFSIIHRETGKETLKDVDWYAGSNDNDSLYVFAQYKKRGYFNSHTGEVAIPPVYRKAWVFSDGLAAVVKGDSLYFLDEYGNTRLKYRYYRKDSHFPNGMDSFCFHDGLCVMYNADKKFGVIDKSGKWVIAPEYDLIYMHRNNSILFSLKKDDKYGFADAQGQVISSCQYKDIEISSDGIFVSLEDNSQRHLNEDGTMTNDFLCYNLFSLKYDADLQTKEDGETVSVPKLANLLCYVERSGYKGLMDKTGRRITPPRYKSIEAIGPDLYRCGYDSQLDNAVLMNGKGEVLQVN